MENTETIKRRRRHQAGCVLKVKRQGKLVWVGQYRAANGKKQITGPLDAKTKSEARARLAEFLVPVNNERSAMSKDPNITVAAYCEHVYIPLGKRKWKASTAITTTQRITQHIIDGVLGKIQVSKLTRETVQSFLDTLGHYSKSVVNQLRFDLNAICRLAVTDGLAANNQSEARVLFAPRTCKHPNKPVMTAEQVKLALSVLDIRERAFCRLAIYAGMRPGEIIALQWGGISDAVARIDKRFYKGAIDEPKNNKLRDASLSSSVVADLNLWKQFALPSPYVFASETCTTPVKYENLWQRDIKPRFKKVGLEWADFRCMRRTNSSLMKAAGGDDKVGADQRGHNVNTSVNVYQQSTKAEKAQAVELLENLIQ